MRPKFTWILVSIATIGLAVGASFGAGTVYGRNSATTTTVTVTGAGTQAGQGATQSGQSGGTADAGLRPVTGSVTSVDGQTLKITTAAGTAVTVNMGTSAQIGKASSSDKSALAPGASVFVLGQRQQDGSVNGSTVLVVPQGFLGQ